MQIDQIGCSQCSGVVLDVSALRRLDPVGTRVLVGLDHYVSALGARLSITGARGQVAEELATSPLISGTGTAEDNRYGSATHDQPRLIGSGDR